MRISAVIFDLDGVIVTTDEYHYQAWKRIAEEEGVPFDRKDNEALRGVSRMDSLEKLLKKSTRIFTLEEKERLCARKNAYYKDSLVNLSPDNVMPGVFNVLQQLRQRSLSLAIGSSSKNTPLILQKLGLSTAFDAVSDGNMIRNSKPDPEVFLLAAQLLKKSPSECVVVEDASAGIEAAINAGMKAVGVGAAQNDASAHYKVLDLAHISIDQLLA